MVKKLSALIVLLMVAGSVFGNFMIFYDPNSFVIPNRTTKYLESVNPNAADGRNDAKVVDTLPPGFNVSTFKWDGANFVPITQQEFDRLAATNSLLSFVAQVGYTNDVRQFAKAAIQSEFDEQNLLLRALALTIMDEINLLRAQHSLAPRTALQLRNAIQSKVDSLTADKIE